jgi:tetratricopeptide (TPR) repeat protein
VKLREHLEAASNDYTELEERYRAATGAELVLDPFGSYSVGVPLTKTMSVLVGANDARDSLCRSLESIAASTMNTRYPDLLEVIVVDDGSRDGTWKMLRALELDLRLTCIVQENAGLNHAHNTALAAASGDIIVFSDADVLHTPFALEELAKRHEILAGVTLIGFRFDVHNGADPAGLAPAFWQDFRLSFPGVPTNMCRETSHLKDLGAARRLEMANGASYNLPALVVGAFFSIERDVLVAAGASEPRLTGWGCEDSLIGARSIALGNYVVPVYSAASAHVAHPPRSGQHGQAQRNFALARSLLEEEFEPNGAVPPAARSLEHFRREPSARIERPEPVLPVPGVEAFWALGRYAEAVACAVPLGRGKALRELGRHEEALEELEAAQRQEPHRAEPVWEEALTHAVRGEYGNARTALERAHLLEPSFWNTAWTLGQGTEAHKRRGNAHARQGLHHIAVRDFDLALALEPRLPWTHFDRGESLAALDRLDEAERALRQAEALFLDGDANLTWVHAALADVHRAAGRRVQAKLETERALRLYSENSRAATTAEAIVDDAEAAAGLACTLPLLRSIADVPGWLSDGDADLLRAAVVRASTLGAAILELGSFLGRSTILIARTLQLLGTEVSFTAVDPHRAYDVGGMPDTYDAFLDNLRRHGVEQRVRVVRCSSHELVWDEPIALLFVDALHDYENVRRDHELFDRFVVPCGFIAFHDYFDDFPGVVQHVDSLLAAGELERAGHRDRLIVLRRPPVAVS